MRPLLVVFAGGASGPWRIQRIDAVIGESLPITERLAVLEGEPRPLPRPIGYCVALRATSVM